MSSMEDFLNEQQYEDLDELDPDAEAALLADNDDALGKQSYDDVEFVDEDGNLVEIGENDDVEVFEITEGHEKDPGFDDVLDLAVEDDPEFDGLTQDIGTPGISRTPRNDEVRHGAAQSYRNSGNIATPVLPKTPTEDNKSDADYNQSLEEESVSGALLSDSEEDDDEDSNQRGRFKSERANIVSLASVKKRVDIPDSLDAIVVSVDMPKGQERGRNMDYSRMGRNARPNAYNRPRPHGKLPAPIPLLSLPFQQPKMVTSREMENRHRGSMKDSGGHEQWTDPHQKDGNHSSRKILINPHFKGSEGGNSHRSTAPPQALEKQAKFPIHSIPPSEFMRHPLPNPPLQAPPPHSQQLQYNPPYTAMQRPPEAPNNPPQVHGPFVPPPGFPDPQPQMPRPQMNQNPVTGHPILLHPNTQQLQGNFQCPQFNQPPPHLRPLNSAPVTVGTFAGHVNNYGAQGSVLGNYPGTGPGPPMYQNVAPQHQMPPPPLPPQFNQYQAWNQEPMRETKPINFQPNEPWNRGVPHLAPDRFQGPSVPAPQMVQQPPPRWRPPSHMSPLTMPRPPQHQGLRMHRPIFPAPHTNISPGTQRQPMYRPPGTQHHQQPRSLNQMGDFQPPGFQGMKVSAYRRHDTALTNPQGTGPVLRLISPLPMHELQRRKLIQQHASPMDPQARKRPLTVKNVVIGQDTPPMKVMKTPGLAMKPKGIKERVGNLQVTPVPSSSAVGTVFAEEEEDEDMKEYRAKIEMQKRRREEILRIKEQRRQKMAEQRRREFQFGKQEPTDNTIPLAQRIVINTMESQVPQPVAVRLRANSDDVSVPTANPSPVIKKRVFLVRKPSTSGPITVVPVTSGLQVVGSRSLVGTTAPAKTANVNAPKQQQPVPSRISLITNPTMNRQPDLSLPRVTAKATRIVTIQSEPPVNPAQLHLQAVDLGVIKPVQQRVVSTIPRKKSVMVENLAQATTEMDLKKLCSTVGQVESIRLDKVQRVARIIFQNQFDAEKFMAKFQRRMVDLSVINISLI